jgi:hypothetical protein
MQRSIVNRSLPKAATLCAIGLAVVALPAHANVVYVWQTRSATLDGAPTGMLAAFGEITLTDAAVAGGFASAATSNPQSGVPVETLDGVVSASFGFSLGPAIQTPYGVIDFTATPDGGYLDVSPENLYGGFFVNAVDTDAYFAVGDPGSDILTIGYGTDDAGSPCFGPQEPASSRCVVTGVFEAAGGTGVPEPSALLLFTGALGLLAMLLLRRRRRAVEPAD